MIKRSKILIITVAILGFLTGVVAYRKTKPKRLNVLVLSTCSLSPSRLGFYNREVKHTRPIDKVAEHAFVFENAVTDMSWSNVSGFLSRIPASYYKEHGYRAIGRPWSDGELDWQHIRGENVPEYYMRIPNFERSTRNAPTNYREDLNEVESKLKDRKNWPFIVEVHNKVVHLPYLKGSFKLNSDATKLISEDSQQYIQDYREKMENYPERIPFSFYVVERSKKLTKAVIKILKLDKKIADELLENAISPTFVGLLNNPQILSAWQKSKFFEKDLAVIKETYDNVINVYAKSIQGMLNLYGDKELQDNTVIIYTGDHGEAFLGHGFMVHGETVFDDMIKFPLFIKFPGQKNGSRIKLQFYQKGIADIVRKIMSGELNKDNFEEYINKHNNHPLIYSRNCANNIKSLRYKNEWKFVENLRNDQKFLYHLVTDPGEKNNVYDNNPDIATYLEENIDRVATAQLKNKMLHLCSPENE